MRPRFRRAVREIAETITAALRGGGKLILAGNGGSAGDAQHLAGEMLSRLNYDRAPAAAIALTTDSSVLTAIANDYGYDAIFARQIEAKGSRGDVAVGLTTSGESASVVAGLAKAREMGMRTIALTGHGGGKCAEHADVLLDVPARSSPRIQEAHAVIYHVLCELIERGLTDK